MKSDVITPDKPNVMKASAELQQVGAALDSSGRSRVDLLVAVTVFVNHKTNETSLLGQTPKHQDVVFVLVPYHMLPKAGMSTI